MLLIMETLLTIVGVSIVALFAVCVYAIIDFINQINNIK